METIEHNPKSLSRLHWIRPAAAILSGLMLAFSFEPLRLYPLAFLSIVPLAAIPQPRKILERLFTGLLFGYAHFATALFWLNTVGFGAGFLLSLWCMLFPMLWYLLLCLFAWHLKPIADTGDALMNRPGASLGYASSQLHSLFYILALSSFWCLLEWIRGWLFSGIPWNPLGQCLGPCATLRQLAALGGTSLPGFLIVIFNLSVSEWAVRRRFPLSMGCASAMLAAACLYGTAACATADKAHGKDTPKFHVLAIQGDVPECRSWDDDIFSNAFRRYADLTRQGIAQCKRQGILPDIILWPEGAMPPAIVYRPYAESLNALLQEIQLPLLAGAIDIRGTPKTPPEQFHVTNSVFLLHANEPMLLNPFAERQNFYDKVHLVPFGEYVPFSDYLPWLVEAIGMGRNLKKGSRFNLIQLPCAEAPGGKISAGINICFEDVFPNISRCFTSIGADLLFTLTNDCWYKQSAGAAQHREHARFRAIENRRYLMRSGNNSDTCLITPCGEIIEPILDSSTGNPFTAGCHCYAIPIEKHPIPFNGLPWLLLAFTCIAGTSLFTLYRKWLHFHLKMHSAIQE